MDDLEQVDDYYRTVPQNAAADYNRFDDLGLHISAEDKHNFETDDHSVVQLEADRELLHTFHLEHGQEHYQEHPHDH